MESGGGDGSLGGGGVTEDWVPAGWEDEAGWLRSLVLPADEGVGSEDFDQPHVHARSLRVFWPLVGDRYETSDAADEDGDRAGGVAAS